jgi:hypothetical protein|tara:strand:+ start:781 stop:2676 length:1896 start_codon:yes stop_codon:yes gene_type:complete
MAKIDRSKKKLVRGVKLTVDHTYDVLNEIGEGLERNIVADQMKHDSAYFRLNYQLPIATPWTSTGADDDNRVDNWAYEFGFALPPTQDYFNAEGKLTADTPVPILDEISFGFDQRDENCLLSGPAMPNPALAQTIVSNNQDGLMEFDNDKDSSSIEFVIFSKAQQVWDSNIKEYSNDEVLRVELPASAYMSSVAKLNPYALGNLNKAFNPYKTYMLAIKLNNFWKNYGGADTYDHRRMEVASLTISLKFKMRLLEPDIATAALTLQNYPKAHLDDDIGGFNNFPGNRDDFAWVTKTPDVAAAEKDITAQATNTAVEGGSAPGIGTTIADIDREFTNKLSGGWSEYGLCATDQQIKAEAAYEVISVPLFCTGIPAMGVGTPVPAAGDQWFPITQLRYGAAANGYAGYDTNGSSRYTEFDRRIIPIKNPLLIHEVLMWYGGTINSGVGINVGVGIATGLKGDQHDYQQVALMSTRGTVPGGGPGGGDIDDFTIDTWSVQPNEPQGDNSGYLTVGSGTPVGADTGAHWSTGKLVKIPLVWGNTDATRNTTYPISNDFGGRPFYVGKGTNITAARTNVGVDGGDETPGATNTDGIEQWIEVRMTLDPTHNGLQANDCLIPPQGYWVYLICKKTLC